MSWFREMAAVAVASVAAVLMIGVPAVAGSPFSSLVGAWSGSGTAHLEGGRSERLSCKGYYSGAGANQLRLNIICANRLDQGRAAVGADLRRRERVRHLGGAELQSAGTISGTASDEKLGSRSPAMA